MKIIICLILFSSFCFAQKPSTKDTLVWMKSSQINENIKKAREEIQKQITILKENDLRYEGQQIFLDVVSDSIQVWIRKPE